MIKTAALFLVSSISFGLVGSAVSAFAADPLAGLTKLDGQAFTVTPAKSHELVVFWATWCDECRAKLGKELVDLDKRADLSVITVNADRDAGRATEFVAKEHVLLPVLRDETKAVRKSLKVFSVPHWALYKKTGTGLELVTAEAAFDMSHVLAALGDKK